MRRDRSLAVVLLVALGLAGPAIARSQGSGESQPNPHMQAQRNPVGDDAALPPGALAVEVKDPEGRPVADQMVVVRVRGADQSSRRIAQTTGADGATTFRDLPTDSDHSFLVEVPYQGATYRAEPFHLAGLHGKRARIVRYPVTTHDDRLLSAIDLQIDLTEDVVRVVEHIQAVNVGQATYVPQNGSVLLPLPAHARNVQTAEDMGDQRLEASGGEGLRFGGSLPPGMTGLAFGFDLPRSLDGDTVEFSQPLRWRPVAFRVFAKASPGMRLEVDGMPPARVEERQGERYLVAEMRRGPDDPAVNTLRVRLAGIPGGTGIWPFVSAAVAFGFVVAGLWIRLGQSRTAVLDPESTARERERLLEEAAEIHRRHQKGDLGPKAFERRRREVVERLAQLYRAKAALSPLGKDAPAR